MKGDGDRRHIAGDIVASADTCGMGIILVRLIVMWCKDGHGMSAFSEIDAEIMQVF